MPRRKPESDLLDVSVYMPVIVNDWLTGGATFVMSNRQRGAFFQLLAHAWKQNASLPDDLTALAKYADESIAWLESPEGAAVLAQWPVDEGDGRRRNPKQAKVYTAAVARRAKLHRAGATASNARWRRDHGDEGGGPAGVVALVPNPPGPNLADAIAAYPAVVAFAASSPEYTKVLHHSLTRVVREAGEHSLVGFVGLVNGALQGMHGASGKPAEVALALEDWCTNAAPVNSKLLRAYFTGARPNQPNAASPRGRRLSSGAAAGADAAFKLE